MIHKLIKSINEKIFQLKTFYYLSFLFYIKIDFLFLLDIDLKPFPYILKDSSIF